MANWDDEEHVSIHDSTSTPSNLKPITSTVDGAKRRFDVDSKISGGVVGVNPFTPKGDFDVVGAVTNTSTDVTLLSVTGRGKLDFIVVAGGNSNYEVVLVVDTVEVLRIKMSDLAALGLSNATNVSIWAEQANKNFRMHPNEGVDFTASFAIKVRATSTPVPTLKHLIAYRLQA